MKRWSIASILVALLATVGPCANGDELTTDPAKFDLHVDPCTDFYRYVNAAWLDSTEIPADQPMWDSRLAARQKNRERVRELGEQAASAVKAGRAEGVEALVGKYYAAGMDEASIEKAGLASLRGMLAQIDALHDAGDIATFLGQHPTLELAFAYYAYSDVENAQQKIPYAEQGGVGIGDRSVYLADDEAGKKVRAAYAAHLARLLTLSGTEANRAQAQANDVLALETKLARAALPNELLREPKNIHHRRTIAEAAKITPHFDWPRFFAGHHASVAVFSLAQADFFGEFDRQLASQPMALWRAYLRARLLDTLAPALPASFAAAHFEFHDKLLRGLTAPPPRSTAVLESLNDRIGMAMGQLYVARYFPPESKRAAIQLVEDLRREFRERLQRNTWIGAATKQAALAKLDAMRLRVGYPDHWPDYGKLVLRADDYAGNVLATADFDAARIAAEVGKPVDPGEWSMLPQTLNAQYDPAINAIAMPAAAWQSPAFDPKADAAQNYAVIGVIIAHEITHGFDDTGRTYDAGGKQRDWWTQADADAFDAMTNRVRSQFDAYEALPGVKVNGRLTAGENIADIGGLEIAFGAMQRALAREGKSADARAAAQAGNLLPPMSKSQHGKGEAGMATARGVGGELTPAQRFFVRYAAIWRNKTRPEFAARLQQTDSHAPEKWRAVGPLSNSKTFADAFQCKAGKGFLRSERERIDIW